MNRLRKILFSLLAIGSLASCTAATLLGGFLAAPAAILSIPLAGIN